MYNREHPARFARASFAKCAIAIALSMSGIVSAAGLSAQTIMISVRAGLNAQSMNSTQRDAARNIMTDVESTLFDAFFQAGMIAFNSQPELIVGELTARDVAGLTNAFMAYHSDAILEIDMTLEVQDRPEDLRIAGVWVALIRSSDLSGTISHETVIADRPLRALAVRDVLTVIRMYTERLLN